MNEEVESYLKEVFYEMMKELSEKYGGYFKKWYVETYHPNALANTELSLKPTMYF